MTSDVTSLFTFCYVFVFVFVLTNGIASIRDQIKKRSNPDEIEESKEEEDDVSRGKNKKYRKDKLFDSSQEYLSSNCSESLISQSDHKLSAASNYNNKYNSNEEQKMKSGLFKRVKDHNNNSNRTTSETIK